MLLARYFSFLGRNADNFVGKTKTWRLTMGNIIRFYAFAIKIAILLALCGQLKSCTLVMMGKAAEKHEIMSYGKFSHLLTGQ